MLADMEEPERAFMAGKPADARKIIRKTWHRLSVFIRKDWRSLLMQIHLGKINVEEAAQQMQTSFGLNITIWNLHGLTLQVPQVPHDLHEGFSAFSAGL